MDTSELVGQAEALRKRIAAYGGDDYGVRGEAARAQTCEFLREYAGPRSSFLKQAESVSVGYDGAMVRALDVIVQSFIEYVQAGLVSGVSPSRQAHLDVVSDILLQAQILLDGSGYHPAAAAMLIGASLEEFLRNWTEEAQVSIGNAKPGIDAYCKALRTAELITKQDVKDITAWAGSRNHAAHGEWDQVDDRGRVRLMLEGVNLFMRQNLGG